MRKVLVVEDDSFYCRRLKEIVIDNGLECVVASSLNDALKINFENIDAAIVDVMLPNSPEQTGISLEETRGNFLSGIALCRKIHKMHQDFPIILISADIAGNEARTWAKMRNILFVCKTEGPERIVNGLRTFGLLAEDTPRAFIVHGHDENALLELKNFIQNSLKWKEPFILREQPSSGKTIIEKFEEQTPTIDYVFVLLTPDDTVLNSDESNDQKRRARQNVIFELGFFYGHFGRQSGRILVLHKGLVEIPTDILGIIWIDISNGVDPAGEIIRKELAL